MIAGLIAGSIAAIVASLVSLPLRSPIDSVFNSATITLASLIVGIAAGLLWNGLGGNPRRLQYYIGALAVVFLVVVVISVVGNATLERSASFVIPLAAVVFLVVGVLTPSFTGVSLNVARGLALVLLVASVGLGFGLMNRGDAASGELSLPERVEATPPPATQTPKQAPTAAPTPAAVGGGMSTRVATDIPAPTREDVSTDTPAPVVTETSVPVSPTGGGVDDTINQYIVGEGSEITFTVGEVLTRFPNPIQAVMRTTELTGQINLDGQSSTIEVDLHALTSDQEYRDRYVRRRMFPDQPTASFTVESVVESVADLPAEFHSGETFRRRVSGVLNLNGEDFPIAFDLEVRNDANVLNVLGRTIVTWEQLNIPVPTARSVVSVEDEIHVQILLVSTNR